MDTLLKLSPAQSLLLRTAARRPDGRVIPPDTLRGGARVKVLTSLLQRGWIEPADGGLRVLGDPLAADAFDGPDGIVLGSVVLSPSSSRPRVAPRELGGDLPHCGTL